MAELSPHSCKTVRLGLFPLLTVLVCGLAAKADAPAPRSSAADNAFFDKEVLPLLQAHCLSCHGGEKAVKGGLKLTSREDIFKGGDDGPVVSLDKPETSLLLKAINHAGDIRMPPKGKLAAAQIETLTKWVRIGVPFSETKAIARHDPPSPTDEKARKFWSFQPVVRPHLPAVKDAAWVKTPVDAFVLAKLEAAGLRPAAPASKTDLLRRVTYDLVGLPPTVAEIDAFVADTGPDAYERVVDRLLQSPHYGERWARHWLDLVRYAETNGYEVDGPKPNVWRFRDYAIKSFNDDKPYDQLVKEQLAGDEIDRAGTEGLIATGYYRLAPVDGGAPDRLQAQYDNLDDLVATTGQVFLGLTVNCARCHDHKIDPFPQKDYYRLLAFFHNVGGGGRRGGGMANIGGKADTAAQQAEIAQRQQQIADLKASIKAFEDALVPHLTGGEVDDFKTPEYRVDIAAKHVPQHVAQQDFEYYRDRVRNLAQLERARPPSMAQALTVSESGRNAPETFVFLRGNPRAKGDKVEPGFPSVLPAMEPKIVPPENTRTSGRRTALANWIASPENPLTARVMANRLWQHHFGRGIVRSSSDFGYQGTPPTHPQLLDWLASEFVAGGWKMKALHRLIVTSAAYRMSSRPDVAALAKDPENDLFWRFDSRRLSAEELRDAILAVSGNINLTKMGGPSIYPKISAEVHAGQSRPGSGWLRSPPDEQARRSVYVHIKRSLILPIHAAFDAADPDSSCPVRFTTTVPTQALGMINGEFLNTQAKVFAESVRQMAGDDRTAQVRATLRRAMQREPSEAEVRRGVEFLARMREKQGTTDEEALRLFCLMTLNLNEFVYLH